MKGIIDPGEDLVSAANILNAVASRNPLLTGLTDCLVDEGNAEEELLLSGEFQMVVPSNTLNSKSILHPKPLFEFLPGVWCNQNEWNKLKLHALSHQSYSHL